MNYFDISKKEKTWFTNIFCGPLVTQIDYIDINECGELRLLEEDDSTIFGLFKDITLSVLRNGDVQIEEYCQCCDQFESRVIGNIKVVSLFAILEDKRVDVCVERTNRTYTLIQKAA